MTATTTWDPAVGGGYLPKTVTVLLPPLTVRSAADGEEQRSERELDFTQRVGDRWLDMRARGWLESSAP